MPSPRISQRADHSAKNLVEFAVGEAHYAVDIFRVREIVNPIALVPMPHAPDFVVGLADHRGEVVPVVDLRRRFGLQPASATLRQKWLVVDAGSRDLGLVVDSVTEVFGVVATDVRPAPDVSRAAAAKLFAGVCSNAGHLTFIVDIDRLLGAEEAKALDDLAPELG